MIQICSHFSDRYPDFLTQMQDYMDSSNTLCDIVGGEISAK